MVSAFLFLVVSKRNCFTTNLKKKMAHIDLKSLRYRVWLWTVRECDLWRCLMDNYERIPSMTLTRVICWLLLNSRLVNRIFSMIEKIVRRRILNVNTLKIYSRRELREKAIVDRWLRSQVS